MKIIEPIDLDIVTIDRSMVKIDMGFPKIEMGIVGQERAWAGDFFDIPSSDMDMLWVEKGIYRPDMDLVPESMSMHRRVFCDARVPGNGGRS